MHHPVAGQVKPGTVENGIFSGLDWFPTLLLRQATRTSPSSFSGACKLGDRTYKNHLDGYNQMDLLTGKGPSKRHEIFYFGGATLGAVRVDDFKFSSTSSLGAGRAKRSPPTCPAWSTCARIRSSAHRVFAARSSNTGAWGYGNDFFAREFWRFVQVQQNVAKLAKTAVDYPPMQDPASFNLDAVKRKVEEMIKNRPGQ